MCARPENIMIRLTICLRALLLPLEFEVASSSASLLGIFKVAASKPGEKINMFWNSRSCISSGKPTTKIVDISSPPLLALLYSSLLFKRVLYTFDDCNVGGGGGSEVTDDISER